MKLRGMFAPALAASLLMGVAGSSKAQLNVDFVSATLNAGLTTYLYNLNVPNNGQLQSGDYALFIDFDGLTGASIVNTNNTVGATAANFNAVVENSSAAPAFQGYPDDPTIANARINFTGTAFNGPTDQPAGSYLVQVALVSTTAFTNQNNTIYSSQGHSGNPGNPINNQTTLVLGPNPVVPEPGTIAMLVGMGVSGSAFMLRRRRAVK